MTIQHLSFHRLSGVRLTYTFSNENGTPRDMTGTDVEFVTSNGFVKSLTVVNGNTDQMQLLLGGDEVPSLVNKKAQYAIIDKTVTPPDLIAYGDLVVFGWTL